jgi:hypothetical protein
MCWDTNTVRSLALLCLSSKCLMRRRRIEGMKTAN